MKEETKTEVNPVYKVEAMETDGLYNGSNKEVSKMDPVQKCRNEIYIAILEHCLKVGGDDRWSNAIELLKKIYVECTDDFGEPQVLKKLFPHRIWDKAVYQNTIVDSILVYLSENFYEDLQKTAKDMDDYLEPDDEEEKPLLTIRYPQNAVTKVVTRLEYLLKANRYSFSSYQVYFQLYYNLLFLLICHHLVPLGPNSYNMDLNQFIDYLKEKKKQKFQHRHSHNDWHKFEQRIDELIDFAMSVDTMDQLHEKYHVWWKYSNVLDEIIDQSLLQTFINNLKSEINLRKSQVEFMYAFIDEIPATSTNETLNALIAFLQETRVIKNFTGKTCVKLIQGVTTDDYKVNVQDSNLPVAFVTSTPKRFNPLKSVESPPSLSSFFSDSGASAKREVPNLNDGHCPERKKIKRKFTATKSKK